MFMTDYFPVSNCKNGLPPVKGYRTSQRGRLILMALIQVSQVSFENEIYGLKWWHLYIQ